jgi:hypothetical protein
MINIFIVIEGGCVRYVSADTDAPIAVDVIDLDDRDDSLYTHPDDRASYDARLKVADSMVRVW